MLDLSLLQLLPEKERNEISDTMFDIVMARALSRLEADMSPETRKRYDAIFGEEQTDDEIAEFFTRHLPQFPHIALEELFRLRGEIAEGVEQ